MDNLWSLFVISLKRTLSNLPAIFAGTIVILITSLLLVIGLYQYTSNTSIDIVQAQIGLVNEDSSNGANLAIAYLGSMSSVKDIVGITLYDNEDEALDALKSNQIVAYGYMPADFISSVLNGTNEPLRITFGDLLPDTGAEYFFDVIDAAASDISISQAAIYAAEDACYKTDVPREERRRINTQVNDIYIGSFIEREMMFDTTYVSQTKGLSLKAFYGCTLILLLLMLSGISFVSLIRPNSQELLSNMKKRQIPLIDSLFTTLISSFAFTLLIAIFWLIIYGRFLFIPSLFLICSNLFSFNVLINRIIKDETVAMLIISALSFILIYLAGGIITISYLSNALIFIGHNTHAGSAFELLKLLTLGTNSLRLNIINLVFLGIFSSLSIILDYKEVNKL